MARQGMVRRHRVGVASGLTLALAAGAILAQALAADGYRSHETELNDGGIWVVNGEQGLFGRVNKPINQLDAVVFGDQDVPLDVVQDGAAVVALNRRSGIATVIDPAVSQFSDGLSASFPVAGDLQLNGGSLAAVDPSSGRVWAVRADTRRGLPDVGALDRQGDPSASAGGGAALAVSDGGTVVVTSAVEGTATFLVPDGSAYSTPRVERLPPAAGTPDALTTVGERVVTLDAREGRLTVLGGATAEVPPGSVLQQPGPAAAAALVATPGALLEVDLDSGAVDIVTEGAAGDPAQPVRLGACVYGAWSGGLGQVATRCGTDPASGPHELGGRASNLVFRVNRDEIVLNDGTSGTVWNVDQDTPVTIDDWTSFTSTRKVEDDERRDDRPSEGDRRPPKAEPDDYGARPGRTTVLHPLDNDSAPKGRLLSIGSVDQPDLPGARTTISPDGQTVQLLLPAGARGSTTFDYFVDDGRSMTARATITVTTRERTDNREPALREGHEPRQWRVPAGGTVSVPVLADWRDDHDGDPLLLTSAEPTTQLDAGAVARTTNDGRVRFTAPATGAGPVQVDYTVSDGTARPVEQSLTFQVQGRDDLQTHAPVAEPDVVRGEVGEPIEIRPLANDLPGSDPLSPDAELALGGRLAPQPGATIDTDVVNGIVTLTADRPRTFWLDYDAGYGNAPLAHNKIRVDVLPRPRSGQDPVAMPDTATLHGQAPATVDVLANDVDPAGALLVVERAEADRPDQLDLAIVDGRWLRVSARQGDLSTNPQVVRYTVSNGVRTARGEVVVHQRPAPRDRSPITVDDKVTLRAGSAVTVPVLDNDISAAGDRLSLVTDAAGPAAGVLEVDQPLEFRRPLARAYAGGRAVRVVAPADVKERQQLGITYTAESSTGETAPGRITVTLVPADEANTAPEPPTLEGRTVSGDTIRVTVPGSHVDPEGDPVTVTGIASPPKLGRLVSFGADSLEYQAYPGSTGTDEFAYTVVDTHGATATGTVRVAIVPPGPPQPPLAVDDSLTVRPGRTATVDVLANDHSGVGDRVAVELVDPPSGVALDEESQMVTVRTPDDLLAPSTQVVYRLTNGLHSSLATLTVRTAEGVDNPPVVFDAFGVVDDSDSVSVDVLEGAYDPDGRSADLVVTDVYADRDTTTVDGSKVRVARGPLPQVIPFRVEDTDGAAAAASLYVPPTGTGVPYVLPDTVIEMEPGGRFRGSLADFVVDPAGDRVELTGRRAASATPSGIDASVTGADSFEVSAAADHRGPGALVVEVTTVPEPDAPATEAPRTALLSIPVQVGEDRPFLQCPTVPVEITQVSRVRLDIGSLCHVWTADPADLAGLAYQAQWVTEARGVTVAQSGTPVLEVSASGAARPGAEAVLAVSAGGSDPQRLAFRVVRAPSPSLLPVRVEDMRPGDSRTLDLAPYLEPGVGSPRPRIVSVTQLSTVDVRASTSGTRLTLRAGPDAEGTASFRIVMSDVSEPDAGPERRVEGRIQLEVLDVPDAPVRVRPAFDEHQYRDGEVQLLWQLPDDNGAPITHHRVEEVNSGRDYRCSRSPQCRIDRLRNGEFYNFRVQACNKVGCSDWSEKSREAFADRQPGGVENIRMTDRGDHWIDLAWDEPRTQTSDIQWYHVRWADGGSQDVRGTSTSTRISGLDNNRPWTFTISATNESDTGVPKTSAPFQPLGTPAAPELTGVSDLESGAAQTTVQVTWARTSPEGPGPTLYTLFTSRDGGAWGAVGGCVRTQLLACSHRGVAYDGATHHYQVRAYNQPSPEPANESVPSARGEFHAVGKPAAWGAWSVQPTGRDQQLEVSFTVPESRGRRSDVSILVNGRSAWAGPATGSRTQTVDTPSNERAYDVQLRVCNEDAEQGGCTLSGVQSAQSYGPLNGMIDSVTHELNPQDGRQIRWTITGSTNGDAATLAWSVGGAAEQQVPLGEKGPFTRTTGWFTAPDYEQRITIRVRLFDTAPDRGSDEVSHTATAGPPPPPSVEVFKAAGCSDAPGSTTPCDGGLTSLQSCEESSCGFVGYRTSGFLTDYSCSVSNPDQRYYFVDEARTTNGTFTSDWYYSRGTVTVTCRSTNNRYKDHRAVSSPFSWPR